MSQQAKWEYFQALYERYHRADRKLKQVILNAFCSNTGYNRKYAIRLLNGPPPGRDRARKRRRPELRYGHQALSVLAGIWEAAGYPWSVRLKALLRVWMPWVRQRFRLGPEVEQQRVRLSPRQMDRRLQARKTQLRRRLYGRTQPGTLLKHPIPLKTESWGVKVSGFTEVDLVSHSGNSAHGEFAPSLNVTDLFTTWTAARVLRGRSRAAVEQAWEEIRSTLPFRLRGIDSDNGSEFINGHRGAWCAPRGIQFTRGRPYKKEDNLALRDGTEKLDPCPQALRRGALRHSASGGSPQRP